MRDKRLKELIDAFRLPLVFALGVLLGRGMCP